MPLFVLLALVPGCSPPHSALEPFAAEKTAAGFPGVSYPARAILPTLPDPPDRRGPVWIVGVDGATWTVMQALQQAGDLPHFSALIEQGAHGTLIAEEPTISPALWATIATGMPRFEHGIVNFLVKLPGQPDSALSGPLDRRSPAIWELVEASGGEAAVISWFGSFPAEQLRGNYISKDFNPANPKPRQVSPESLVPILNERAVVSLRQQDIDAVARTEFLHDTLIDDARTMAVLRVIAAESDPDLLVTYFSGIDVAQHVHWRDMDPATPAFPDDTPRNDSLADVIPSYYRYIDHLLGQIVGILPQGATLMVLSDHGGGPMDLQSAFRLRLDVLLTQLGLMDAEGTGTLLAIDEHFRHDKRIWLNLEEVEADGTVAIDDMFEMADSVARRLEALVTDEDEAVFQSIVNHLGEPQWTLGDPALTVRFAPRVLLARSVLDGEVEHDFSEVRLRRSDVSGTHRPEGILIVRGPEVEPGPLSEPANHYQIAPLVLYLLGLPQDARMLALAPADGGVNEQVISHAVLAGRPIHEIAGYPGTDRTDKMRPVRYSPINDDVSPIEEETLEKLRALGYVN